MSAICIVIYGASLVLAAVEAGLREWPAFDVVHVNPAMPLAIEQVKAVKPQVVIVDGHYDYTGLCPSLILRVDHNANNQAAIFHEQQYPIGNIGELVEIIWRYISEAGETTPQLIAKVEHPRLEKKGLCSATEA